ncbi:hypothetical protein SAMN05443633_10777 [Chryseobacterium arachidis]|uniref:Uncharacterized protein n=1 Tax=Chryseobacterium arachidis TaxID=1416778 RepID=A0A1M5EVL1_9FLAO|nr:hypothetical protein [Chryseobacterium arachidis]SHF83273.1 hypothetical protein SAMN05443633_10777 [Chryseobacterium arachidis]
MIKSTTSILIFISVIIFLISLTQVCVVYKYFGIVNYHAYLAFLVGWMHFVGGGFGEGCIWLANPLYFMGLFLLYKKNKLAIFPLICSSILGFVFLSFENLTMTKSGRIAPIIELKSGYYLWLMSILFITFSSIYLKIKEQKDA